MTRKQIKEQAARYIKYVDWSEEDHCFVGRCPEVFIGAIHGDDEARVYAELCQTVEEWIELLHRDGVAVPEALTGKKQFSGKFVLRVDQGLHKRLAAKALASGDSLNNFCKKALTKA